MGKSICNKCGAIYDDLDVGFSLSTQGMSHGKCGGKFVDYAAFLMGQKKSPRKAASSRENGKKGGRPRNYQVCVDYAYTGHERGDIISSHATYEAAQAASKKTGNDDKHSIRDKRDYER